MTSFIDRMFGRQSSKGSSSQAKDRLRFVLVHDRINLPPEQMRAMKAEILEVISKYVAINHESVDIALEQLDRHNSKIVAEIPFVQTTQPAETGDDNDDLEPGELTSIEKAAAQKEHDQETSERAENENAETVTPEDDPAEEDDDAPQPEDADADDTPDASRRDS